MRVRYTFLTAGVFPTWQRRVAVWCLPFLPPWVDAVARPSASQLSTLGAFSFLLSRFSKSGIQRHMFNYRRLIPDLWRLRQ